ncbi:MAG: FkbM family methyltransferase, partial [Anaerolineales bacterium]
QAVGAATSGAELRSSRRTPTVSTISSKWAATVGRGQAFERVNWDQSYPVTVTTLDELIAEFGLPRFCKLDIEGSELSALLGLSVPLPHLSFEYIPAAVGEAIDCLGRLGELAEYEFNWTVGESHRLRSREWLTKSRMAQRLRSMLSDHRSGDIYARLSHSNS